MSTGRATSIDKLPGDSNGGDAVNEILNEINAPNDSASMVGDGTQIFQRQTDGLVASPTDSYAPQTSEEVQRMHQQQAESAPPMQAEESEKLPSEGMPAEAMGLVPESLAVMTRAPVIVEAKAGFNMIAFAKTTMLFALLYMLFSLRFVRTQLMKIPMFSVEGGMSVLGTVLCAFVGGIIMAGVQTVA